MAPEENHRSAASSSTRTPTSKARTRSRAGRASSSRSSTMASTSIMSSSAAPARSSLRATRRAIERPAAEGPVQDPTIRENHGTACAGVACGNGDERRLRRGAGGEADADPARLRPRIAARGGCVQMGGRQRRRRDLLQLGAGGRRAGSIRTIRGTAGRAAAGQHAPRHRLRRRQRPRRQGLRRPVRRRQRQRVRRQRRLRELREGDRGRGLQRPRRRSVYSDFGKAVWCSFPSNDFGHAPFNHPDPLTPGIWTTDRQGEAGTTSDWPPMATSRATTRTASAAPRVPARARPASSRSSCPSTRR